MSRNGADACVGDRRLADALKNHRFLARTTTFDAPPDYARLVVDLARMG
jgi:hypothetical protein